MNRRHPDSAGLPTPTTMSAGEERFIRRAVIDRLRPQNGDKAGADSNPRVAAGIAALDQSAQGVARHAQIGVTDQAEQQQSP
jgi:hypothetical protein